MIEPDLHRTIVVAPDDDPTRPATVELDRVDAGYHGRLALEEISLTVRAGSLVAVIGPNGAGKSTLLRVMAGLLAPISGSVRVLGAVPGVEARRIAYVPQAEAVDWEFPVSIAEVVMMGRYRAIGVGRRPGGIDRAAVAAALETVGMAGDPDRQIGALSGGQRRRVFLARALASDPEVYLLDEPVTGVDATTQEDLMDVLEAEARAGKTVVATTHDLACAAHRFQQAVLLNRRIVAAGRANLILDPKLLAETYGGHVLVLPEIAGGTVVLDDAHHHDDAAGGEPHYHDDRR
ncbi:MAG: metal ABC transporter ATP-binding protein [Chloroflexota bacterium]